MRLNYIDNIDCLEGLKEIPDNSVDLIVTDPPYFLSMGHAGSKTNAKQSEQLNSNRAYNDLAICTPFYKQLFSEYRRVMKDDGSFYFFTDWRGYAYYFPLLNAELPVRNLIVWDKKSGPGRFYSFAHELIVFGTYKGKTKAIEDSTDPGAVVLDTFIGSGTTALACLRTGRRFIGFELDEKYHAIAIQRVAEEMANQMDQAAINEEDWLL